MKKANYLLVIVLLMLCKSSKAQNYFKDMYDQLGYNTDIATCSNNTHGVLSWIPGERMESLINMYEKSNEQLYLETLIKNIGLIIDRRDDMRTPNVTDYRGIVGPVWSTTSNTTTGNTLPYAHLVHSGNLTFPMAKFANLIINGSTTLQNTISPTYGGRYSNMTYLAIANDVVLKIKETVSYHDDQWYEYSYMSETMGCYKERCSTATVTAPIETQCEIMETNKIASFSRTLVHLYLVTNDVTYLDKIVKTTRFFKHNTHDVTNENYYKWRVRGNELGAYINCSPEANCPRDDVNHAALSAAFPFECYKNNIGHMGTPLYTNSEMSKYAETFADDIYSKPLFLNNGVDYSYQSYDFKRNIPLGDSRDYYSYFWFPFTEINSNIYQQILDLSTSNYYLSTIQEVHKDLQLSYFYKFGTYLAPLFKKQTNGIYKPIADHGWGEDSNWSGVACGDFDGDNAEEIVALRNHDGSIYIKNISTTNGYLTQAFKNFDNTYNWNGAATGNFLAGNQDEFVSLSNSTDSSKNGFHVFTVNGATIQEVTGASSVGWGTGSDWCGIVSGNFLNDNDGYDEFITVRNYQKEFRLYKSDGTNITGHNSISLNTNFPAGSSIASVTAGDFDNDGIDEIAFLLNSPQSSSNGFYVYDVNTTGTLLALTASHLNWGAASDWKTLTSGDLNADGVIEIVGHRNYDGNYYIKKLVGSSLVNVAVEQFEKRQTQNNIFAVGNLDIDTSNEELIVLRNFDGGWVTYTNFNVSSVSNKLDSHLGGNSNITEDRLVKVFPNPSTGSLFISRNFSAPVKYEIYSMANKLISEGNTKEKQLEINISGLKQGPYIIKIYNESYLSINKIIKR